MNAETFLHRRGIDVGCSSRSAFTLVEVVVNLSVLSFLAAGLGSAMMIAGKSLPVEGGIAENTMNAAAVLDELIADLHTAQSFSLRTSRSITMQVSDRTGDAVAETIRYEWSGVAGEAFRKSVNSPVLSDASGKVHHFALNYIMSSETVHSRSQTSTTGPEQLVASFDGWTGLLEMLLLIQPVSTTQHISQCFQITTPKNAESLKFTKASVVLQRGLALPSSSAQITVHSAFGAGNGLTPQSAALGVGGAVPAGGLSPVFGWVDAGLLNTEAGDLGSPKFCLKLAGTGAASANAQGYQAPDAPANNQVMIWSSNGGGTWLPVAPDDTRDLRFRLFGQYKTTQNRPTQSSNNYLVAIEASLQIAADASSRVVTTIQILERPAFSEVELSELE